MTTTMEMTNVNTHKAESAASWSDAEKATALRMKADGAKPVEIAAALGRTEKSVRAKIYTMQMNQAQRLRDNATRNARRYDSDQGRRAAGIGIAVSMAPDIDAIDERNRRIAAPHRDLTALLCGDPPLGFSALDRAERALA